jgi:poly-gamma-glutamate synthesis protein (capsule biosynthesis protein)
MKRFLYILTAFAAALMLTACSKTDESKFVVIDTPVPAQTALPDKQAAAETDAPSRTEEASPTGAVPTAAPTEAVTPVPTEAPTPEPTEVPPVPETLEEAIALYEAVPVDYELIDRAVLEPNHEIAEPRYTLGEDGIYHSSSSTNDNEAVIYFTGDLMCQTRQQQAAQTMTGYDFEESFDYVRSIFEQADLVVGNLEGTFCEQAPYMSEQSKIEDVYHLNAPSTYVEAVRNAGYDMVVMSNNHNVDCGVRGIYDSLDRVDQYKLVHTGLFRNSEDCRYVIMDVDGIKIGFMSYSTFFNRKEWHYTDLGMNTLMNPYSKEVVERDVKAVREAGAEYVMIYIHWGIEYTNDPGMCRYVPADIDGYTGEPLMITIPLDFQYGWAQEIADAGVDYIIGSHTHSLQPYDVITSADGRSVPVIYSMGNFMSHQKKDVSKDTIILRVTLGRDSAGKVVIKNEGYIPAHVYEIYMGKDYVVIPLTSPYNGGIKLKNNLEAYRRITAVMGKKLAPLGWM